MPPGTLQRCRCISHQPGSNNLLRLECTNILGSGVQSPGCCIPLQFLAVPEQACSVGSCFEALQVTAELGLLVHIHTEACAVNHCGCGVVLLFRTEGFIRKLFFVLGRSFSQSSCNLSWIFFGFSFNDSSKGKPGSHGISPLQAEDS